MLWSEFKANHPFTASVHGLGKDGEVTGEQIGQVVLVCRDFGVSCQVGPNKDQIFLGGVQEKVVLVLDKLNAEGGRGSIKRISRHP